MKWCGGGRATSDVLGGKKRIFGGGKRGEERDLLCELLHFHLDGNLSKVPRSSPDLALGERDTGSLGGVLYVITFL